MMVRPQLLLIVPFLFILVACSPDAADDASTKNSCPLTEPKWLMPPEDAAVNTSPEYGYYFVNKDQSIWASAWQVRDEESAFRTGDEGNKIGWFRPAGAELMITGRRLDAQGPPLEAKTGCCYPTRFQASAVYFPTEGCWEINAQAEDRKLSFVVWLEP